MTTFGCRGPGHNAHNRLVVLVLALPFLTKACVTASKDVSFWPDLVDKDSSLVEPGEAVAIIPEKGISSPAPVENTVRLVGLRGRPAWYASRTEKHTS
jgi:hypothetical protein